jgi:hypothetical protein
MLHWYHFLRYYKRTQAELGISFPDGTVPTNEVLRHYYFLKEQEKVVESPSNNPKNLWGVILWNMANDMAVEEMRTILGVPTELKGYLNGDDLSENLFRHFCTAKLFGKNFYMRFGERNEPDKLQSSGFPIKKAWEVVKNAAKCYD